MTHAATHNLTADQITSITSHMKASQGVTDTQLMDSDNLLYVPTTDTAGALHVGAALATQVVAAKAALGIA